MKITDCGNFTLGPIWCDWLPDTLHGGSFVLDESVSCPYDAVLCRGVVSGTKTTRHPLRNTPDFLQTLPTLQASTTHGKCR